MTANGETLYEYDQDGRMVCVYRTTRQKLTHKIGEYVSHDYGEKPTDAQLMDEVACYIGCEWDGIDDDADSPDVRKLTANGHAKWWKTSGMKATFRDDEHESVALYFLFAEAMNDKAITEYVEAVRRECEEYAPVDGQMAMA